MAVGRINAFPAWQERVRNPLASGNWGLNQTKVTNDEGRQASLLSTYRGPGRERVLEQLQRHGLVTEADVDATSAAREADRAAKAATGGTPATEQADRMHRAFGVSTGATPATPAAGANTGAAAGTAAAHATDAGSLMLLPFPDGDHNLVSPLRELHVQLGHQPIAQSEFDVLMSAQRDKALRAAADAVLEAFSAAGRLAR